MVAYVHIEYYIYQFSEESKGGWNPDPDPTSSSILDPGPDKPSHLLLPGAGARTRAKIFLQWLL